MRFYKTGNTMSIKDLFKWKKWKIIRKRIVKVVMIIISLLGCLYVFKINEVNISGSTYQVMLPIKFTIFVIITAMLIILFIL